MKPASLKNYFLVAVISLFASCNNDKGGEKQSNEPKGGNPLVGKWVLRSAMGVDAVDANTYLIINNDHTAVEHGSLGDTKRTWSSTDDELCVKASQEDGGIESCGKYKLKGDKLTWTVLEIEMVYERE